MNKLKVVQFQGLAPSVFCSMYFADQGAQVIFVARGQSGGVSMPFDKNILNRNKKCIKLNFKDKQHMKVLRQLLKTADIVIDPFRPGVLQKLKLGPKDLYELNKKIILLRVSGYGQTGENKMRPGHDMNYLAVGGIIPLMNQTKEYQFPANYVADFVSASLGITGVLGALQKRQMSGEGFQVDCSLANGCTYLSQKMIANQSRLLDQQEEVKTMKIKEKQYVLTGKKAQYISLDELQELMKGKDHYCSQQNDLEISQVKGIGQFDPNAIGNPFSFRPLKNILRAKGANTEQIFSRFRARL